MDEVDYIECQQGRHGKIACWEGEPKIINSVLSGLGFNLLAAIQSWTNLRHIHGTLEK